MWATVPTPAGSAERQQRDLKAGTRAEGRAELSGSRALREQDRAEAKGRGHSKGAGQGMLRGCQGQNTLSAEGNN